MQSWESRRRIIFPRMLILEFIVLCYFSYLFDVSKTGCAAFLTQTGQSNKFVFKLGAFKKKRDLVTVSDLVKEVTRDTDKLQTLLQGKGQKKTKGKRSRQRVAEPKQQYVYASQKKDNDRSKNAEVFKWWQQVTFSTKSHNCDWVVSDVPGEGLPILLESIPLESNTDDIDDMESTGSSTAFVHVLYKPAGWSILGNDGAKKNNNEMQSTNNAMADTQPQTDSATKNKKKKKPTKNTTGSNTGTKKQVKYYNDEDDSYGILDYQPNDIWDVLTPEEREEFDFDEWQASLDDMGANRAKVNFYKDGDDNDDSNDEVYEEDEDEEEEDKNLSGPANILSTQRPSLVNWFKQYMMESKGISIRGGNNWKAIAGAVDIDDSGLVLLVPRKSKQNSILIPSITYVGVVGNGKNMSFKKKSKLNLDINVELLAKLKKGRETDEVQVLEVTFSMGDTIGATATTCADIIPICEEREQDGIRGDVMSHPLDRRASRRLLHCEKMEILVEGGQPVLVESPLEGEYPCDISIYTDRTLQKKFSSSKGNFVGRKSLQQNDQTNAYREINGAGDGLPGWIIDRYDKHLLVQEQQMSQQQSYSSYRGKSGPLPSIHSNHTDGIYHVLTLPDRSTQSNIKPIWMEGTKKAPEIVKVKENGITYHVKMGTDWSTGLFLDQRPSRAWLSQHCTMETRVLNCFAHCGAFSVAAATAGASTVSLDLDSKWLDRIHPQLEDNGITDMSRHDTIYGDCFDWLKRLGKRGEKFDIVILDPPSTSVANTKKKGKARRWSVKNDMDELVKLAVPLVKTPGGLLFTTTNSASLSAYRFAKLCQNGLEGKEYQLDRIVPMPHDFPTIGPSPVKNIVWRIVK